jgi:Sugar phosphate permease
MNKIDRYNVIYPGNLWCKRLRHIAILFTISFNLCINTIQNKLVEYTYLLSEWTETYIGTAVSFDKELVNGIKKIEQTKVGWLFDYFNYKPKENKKLEGLHSQVKGFNQAVDLTVKFLHVISILMWGSIAYSILWLLCDLYFSKRKSPLICVFGLALLVNVFIYYYLQSHLQMIF